MNLPISVPVITEKFDGQQPSTHRRLRGYGLFAVVGLAVAALGLSGWLLGRRPPAAPQNLFAPAWAAGLPAAAIASNSADLRLLPPELAVPPLLPAGLQDGVLLEAWVRLYNQVTPIQLWDDHTLTGRALAMYLLDQAISVVWNTGQACVGQSCGLQYCPPPGRVCTYADALPGVDPIYIRAALRDDRGELVGVLAHEIFHRTQPFGPVPDTRFEEYWAMVLMTRLSPPGWVKFGDFDPLNAGQLDLWITANHLIWYEALEAYPDSITPVDVSADSAGDPFADIPVGVRPTP